MQLDFNLFNELQEDPNNRFNSSHNIQRCHSRISSHHNTPESLIKRLSFHSLKDDSRLKELSNNNSLIIEEMSESSDLLTPPTISINPSDDNENISHKKALASISELSRSIIDQTRKSLVRINSICEHKVTP